MLKSFARTAYEVELYELSIKASNTAIGYRRTTAEVHKYKALSLKALGRLDEAVETMNQAIFYETPWDPSNVEKALKLYNDLLAAQQKQRS